MSKAFFFFLRRGKIREECGYSILAVTDFEVLNTVLRWEPKRFWWKFYCRNLSLSKYKTHTLSGSNDIQATRCKPRWRKGGYHDFYVYLRARYCTWWFLCIISFISQSIPEKDVYRWLQLLWNLSKSKINWWLDRWIDILESKCSNMLIAENMWGVYGWSW